MIEVDDLVKRHGALEVLRGVSLSVAPGRGGGDHRPLGRRQEHVPPLPERAGAVPGGLGRRSTASGSTPDAGPGDRARDRSPGLPAGRDGLPGLQPVPAPDGPRERDRGADLRPGAGPRPRPRSGPGGCSTASACATGSHAHAPRSSPAASSSGSRSPGRWRWSRRRSSSTSRPAPSTRRMTAEVLAVMTDLARDGLTMVVVTHAMRFARQVAQTVHVFGDGRVVESGPSRPDLRGPARGGDPAAAVDRPGGLSVACSGRGHRSGMPPLVDRPDRRRWRRRGTAFGSDGAGFRGSAGAAGQPARGPSRLVIRHSRYSRGPPASASHRLIPASTFWSASAASRPRLQVLELILGHLPVLLDEGLDVLLRVLGLLAVGWVSAPWGRSGRMSDDRGRRRKRGSASAEVGGGSSTGGERGGRLAAVGDRAVSSTSATDPRPRALASPADQG